jgi:hypothetical protein
MEPKVYYRIHKNTPLFTTTSQINPVYTLTNYLPFISHFRLPPLQAFLLHSVHISQCAHACYMRRSSHSSLHHLNGIWWIGAGQIAKNSRSQAKQHYKYCICQYYAVRSSWFSTQENLSYLDETLPLLQRLLLPSFIFIKAKTTNDQPKPLKKTRHAKNS